MGQESGNGNRVGCYMGGNIDRVGKGRVLGEKGEETEGETSENAKFIKFFLEMLL